MPAAVSITAIANKDLYLLGVGDIVVNVNGEDVTKLKLSELFKKLKAMDLPIDVQFGRAARTKNIRYSVDRLSEDADEEALLTMMMDEDDATKEDVAVNTVTEDDKGAKIPKEKVDKDKKKKKKRKKGKRGNKSSSGRPSSLLLLESDSSDEEPLVTALQARPKIERRVLKTSDIAKYRLNTQVQYRLNSVASTD
jgi:hypothetical protein